MERHKYGDVKVDRARLQEQLTQFQLDKEKMRNRNLEYSPRFRSGDELRMTGSGDNRSASPTFPSSSRVTGKEKRRRVHAWLGAQIGSESVAHDSSAAACNGAAKLPEFQTPELPEFAKNVTPLGTRTRNDSDLNLESKDGSDLLRSKSEFVPGDAPLSYPRELQNAMPGSYNREHVHHAPARVLNGNQADTGTLSYKNSVHAAPETRTWASKSLTSTYKTPQGDFSGGGDSYCYLYDPLVAKAYTKKYSVSPSVNTPPPPPRMTSNLPYNSDASVPKYAPASENFTPSPAMLGSNLQYNTPHMLHGVNGTTPSLSQYAKPYSAFSVQDVPPASMYETSFPLPTKYEEYDMRPIKPLDVNLKKSLYGDAPESKENLATPKPQQPRPYLRRSHPTGVSYPIPKPGARSRDKVPSGHKITSRVQNNVEGKHKVAFMRGSPQPSPLSPRKKRRSNQVKSDVPPKSETKISTDTQDATASDGACEETPRPCYAEEKCDAKLEELPVDLKHVKAATKIQAVWKGYRTRKLDSKVVEIRQEVRARRAEQYISVLCHEVHCLKEDLDAEKKMRDLQTEAIRYIWAQLRTLQKQQGVNPDSKKDNLSKRKSPERRPRSKSTSPRRGTKRGSKRCTPQCSPHGTPRGNTTSGAAGKTRHRSESSAMDFEDETESVDSTTEDLTQKRADVSWKEVPDEAAFQGRKQNSREADNAARQQAAEDTDEGRGTLVTDGEGNPAHSSAEDDSPVKPGKSSPQNDIAEENLKLKSTIDVLQEQVAQLQEAILSLSDKILHRSRSDVNLDAWDEEEDLKLVSEGQDQEVSMVASPSQNLSRETVQEQYASFSPEPALSARGEVPRISLKNALTTLRSALSENELWALCEQGGHNIKSKPLKKYLALETTYIRKDGRVEFSDKPPDGDDIDEMYLAPEVLENESSVSIKSSVFSLSVVLWSAADWEMSTEQAPQLSQELESLLVVMSQDDVAQRAEVDDVIQICEDHHAKAGVNSLCVCSSLFAEVQDALTLAKSGKINQKKIALEVSREQEMFTKKMFKEKVVPDINSCTWRSNLKPAGERVLSPRPHQEPTPHEKLMSSLSSSKLNLRKSPRPKVFTVRDMFLKDPELVHKLNIIPGQRRKNQKAMRLVMRRQSPKDPTSAPMPGVPTPPRALRAGVSDATTNSGLSSVILRWHPAKIFDKHGQEASDVKVIGYRIYVNGHPKGMVAGTKSRALLEGLRQSTEYRVHVRAVSSLGESDPSNIVIAHITSSPLPRSLEASESNFELSPAEASQKTLVQAQQPPVALPRAHTAPAVRPRLGAVFPNQNGSGEGSEALKTQNPPGKECGDGDAISKITAKTSPKSDSEKGDDVIDRVLRRYGIQQTAAIVPGYASGSTLSPMPVGFPPKPTSSVETNRRSAQSSLLEDMTKSVETSSVCSGDFNKPGKDAVHREGKRENATPSSQASGDATSKSMELLAQLKSELLG